MRKLFLLVELLLIVNTNNAMKVTIKKGPLEKRLKKNGYEYLIKKELVNKLTKKTKLTALETAFIVGSFLDSQEKAERKKLEDQIKERRKQLILLVLKDHPKAIESLKKRKLL